MQTLILTITEDQNRQRLDKALSELSEHSRSYVQQLLADGNVFFDGAPCASPTRKVKAGEQYELRIPDATPLALEPVTMDLDIVFEDDWLLVINKAAGVTVHPAPGTKEPTLVHGLLAHCGDSLSGIGGVARPGIVHRLDKDTSGLIIVAKNDAAHQHLSAQLKDRSLSRTYDAICWGLPLPPAGTIDAPIGRHPKDRTRMAVPSRGGKEARTHYESSMRFAFATHLRCKLESGRTHQIRVHLNHIGHGLVGDPVYGQSTEKRLQKCQADTDETLRSTLIDFSRQALHAAEIKFLHPTDNKERRYEAPLPEDMKKLLHALQS